MDAPGILGPQVTMAVLVVWALQKIKECGWIPAISDQTPQVTKFIGIVASALSSVGLHLSFDSNAGVLTITGLTLVNLMHFSWGWIQQHAFQESFYKIVQLSDRSKRLRIDDRPVYTKKKEGE